MYFDPFAAGVICTLFVEMSIVMAYAILKSFGGKK